MNSDTNITNTWYRPAVWTSIVAGGFCLVVCAMLLVNYYQSTATDPLDSEEFSELKTALAQRPQDEQLKIRIRQLDEKLREGFFRRQEFGQRGRYLLLVGMVVCLIAMKFAADCRKKPPIPELQEQEGADARSAAMARWSVGIVFGGTVCGLALLLMIRSEPTFTAEVLKSEKEAPPPVEIAASYPSREQIEKNWPGFRGPGGAGVSAYDNAPSYWNGKTGEGIRWKSPIPLSGKNSPIVWEDRVFVTGADKDRQEIYCFDARSGQLMWKRRVSVPRRSSKPTDVMEATGYAAPTAVTDGRRVYAIFASGDVAGFDFDGEKIWARSFGPLENMYGHSSSLAMYRNLVLVLLDQGSSEDNKSRLMALDGLTGKPIWQTDRPVGNSWASPIVIGTEAGEQIITLGDPWAIAYDPAGGKELWRVDCLSGDVAPSPIYAAGLVFVAFVETQLTAIRPDGQTDVTKTHIAWTAEDGLPDISSPVSNGELVFLLDSAGLLTCYDAKDGKKMWEKDFETPFNASPGIAGNRVYMTNVNGVTFIVEAAREYKQLGRAELDEACDASPAFLDGRIYIRGEKHLYCIENAKK